MILNIRLPPLFFSETDFIYNYFQLVQKNEQKINVGSQKKIKSFVDGTWNPAILRLQGAWNYGR